MPKITKKRWMRIQFKFQKASKCDTQSISWSTKHKIKLTVVHKLFLLTSKSSTTSNLGKTHYIESRYTKPSTTKLTDNRQSQPLIVCTTRPTCYSDETNAMHTKQTEAIINLKPQSTKHRNSASQSFSSIHITNNTELRKKSCVLKLSTPTLVSSISKNKIKIQIKDYG